MSDQVLQQRPGGRDYVQESQGTVKGGGLVAKLGGSRNAAIVGAGGTVVLVALLALRKNKGGSDGTVTTVTGDTAFDSGPYDMWQQWQDEYEQLQEQIDAKGGTTTATGPGQTHPTWPPRRPPARPPTHIPRPPVPPPAPKGGKPKSRPKPPAGHWYTVKHGDTLSEIAQRYHISMSQLKKWNPKYWTQKKYQDGNMIWAGDKVRVK